MQFTPVEDFWSDELQSHYCKGLSYRARPEDTKLLELLPQWLAAGKITEGLPPGVAASGVEGTGDIVEKVTITQADVRTIKASDLAPKKKK